MNDTERARKLLPAYLQDARGPQYEAGLVGAIAAAFREVRAEAKAQALTEWSGKLIALGEAGLDGSREMRAKRKALNYAADLMFGEARASQAKEDAN